MPSRENMNQESASAEFEDDSYVSRPGQKNEDLNVVSDKDQIEDPIDEATADSEEQLGMIKIPEIEWTIKFERANLCYSSRR